MTRMTSETISMMQAIAAPRIIIFLELGDDQERRDFGLERHVAGDEDDRAIFAGAAREGEREAGRERRQDSRHNHPKEGLEPGRAEGQRGFLDLARGVGEHRLDRPHHERQADEGQREDDAGGLVGDRRPSGSMIRPIGRCRRRVRSARSPPPRSAARRGDR